MKCRAMIVNAALFAAASLGTVSAVELPEGYVRLNYIESTYKQCIKTGYTPVWGDKIECVAKITNAQHVNLPTLFGTRDGESDNHYYFAFVTDGQQHFGFADGHIQQFNEGDTNFRTACGYLGGYDGGFIIHLTMQTNVVEWSRHDGTNRGRIAVVTDETLTINRELYIFGVNHQDRWVSNCVNMRLYSFKVTSADGTVRCEFVPCYRRSDSAVGVYDVVRDEFFANESTLEGTGPFVAGQPYGSLPLGFRKAKYIESTSEFQYIDTGYIHGTNDLVVMDYYAPKTWQINGYCYLFGSRAGGNNHNVPENWYFYIGGANQDYICYNRKASSHLKSPATYDYLSDPVHLECQARTATWICGEKTGSLTSSATYADWTEGTCPLYIFGGDFNGTGIGDGNCTVMRLYSFKIYRDINGEMVPVRDFIPCVGPSGAAGLYDRIGDRFHGNARSGVADFNFDLCDRALPDGYTQVDYIRSTSARQYIDTGYWHGTNDLVVMEYYAPKYWQINGYCYLFGSRAHQSGGHSNAENWSFYIGGVNQNRVNYNHQSSSGNSNPSVDVYDYGSDPIRLECRTNVATWVCGDTTNSFVTSSSFANWIAGKYPLCIFGGNCGGAFFDGYSTVMRLYSFKICRDIGGRTVPVRDFVPCRNPDGAAGLYDLVGDRFYGNARVGGDDFVAKSFMGTVLSIR